MGGDNDNNNGRNPLERFMYSMYSAIEGPVVWFREKVVVPNQQTYPWYHQKVRRVPTIDECYTDDMICIHEANEQFRRDKLVDSEILSIMRRRFEDCMMFEGPDGKNKCKGLYEAYQKAAENWFIKYGDLGGKGTVVKAFMKQKHRLLWERRHGPVGTGMRTGDVTSEEQLE